MHYEFRGALLLRTVLIGLAAAPGVVMAAPLTPVEQLGKSIFFDADLSANGVQSCSFCHDPGAGFTSPQAHFNKGGAVIEGAVPGRFGNRKPPSAAYAAASPVLHHILDEGDVTFVGGAFLDGRATGGKLGVPTADQAEGPFLNPVEMAMPHAACVVQRVLHPAHPESYPVTLADVWGADAADLAIPADVVAKCGDPDARITIADEDLAAKVDDAFGKIALSVSAFEHSAEVEKFSSRYDAWVAGKGTLTAEELAGFDLFKDEKKGNCAACHVIGPNTLGGPAVFTDWTFDNLGVPRNRDNPYYKDASNPQGKGWADLGLGGYLKTDPVYVAYADANMARQQVPTLRNMTKGLSPDMPRAYMHNGYFKTLEGVVHFYNTRDTLPRCADPMASEAEAMAQKCWPEPEYAATENKDELGNLKLTADEEAKIVAFLKTLDDQ